MNGSVRVRVTIATIDTEPNSELAVAIFVPPTQAELI